MELKNCPFCGAKVEIIRPYPLMKALKLVRFVCTNPNCKAKVEFDNIRADYDEEAAREMWNGRCENVCSDTNGNDSDSAF